MSYYAPYIDKTGIHVPSYTDVMDHLLEGYQKIFGDDVYLGNDTQDYQMMSLFASCWEDLTSLIMDAYNSRNPDWATGATLDALCALNGITRIKSSVSTVTLMLTGNPGATLEAGQLARDSAGYQWQTNDEVTFDTDGDATVEAFCTIPGAITADADTIQIISSPSYDWYTVTNPSAATVGSDDETDVELRDRRRSSIALSAKGTKDAIVDALVALGEESVVVYENDTDDYDPTILTNAHGIHAVVYPGLSSDDISKAIYLKKSPGISTSGSTNGNYTDIYGMNNTVFYSVASVKNVSIKIILTKKSGWASDSQDNLTSRIIDKVNNLDIGTDLQASELYGPCYSSTTAPTEFNIDSITVNASSSVDCGVAEILKTSADLITYSIS